MNARLKASSVMAAVSLSVFLGAGASAAPSLDALSAVAGGSDRGEGASGFKTCPPLFYDFRALEVKNVTCKRGKSVIVEAYKLSWDGKVEMIQGFRCTMGSSSSLINCTRDGGRQRIHWDSRE